MYQASLVQNASDEQCLWMKLEGLICLYRRLKDCERQVDGPPIAI